MKCRLALIAAAVAVVAPACSTNAPEAAPTASTVTVTAPAPSGPTTAAPSSSPTAPVSSGDAGCPVNPANAPVPTVERYDTVPEADQVSVALGGLASDTVRPGAAPIEFEVTVCNDSPVSYPSVGLTVFLEQCSCAPGPLPIARGSVETLDPVTGTWTASDYPSAGTGMDYLGAFMNVQPLPKGKALTLRYRFALDANMVDGEGGVAATAVTADGTLNGLGTARRPFTVSTSG
ncbi:hypothetical protein [Mycobacterium deserti]|uniref:DUF11 domain-containing protein n=1 Tax=Mycobacterium deserti TaxID=2978347 RepID=A0ABT2MDH9_9MYCO|nr:hypothetical protein [Mycobacterium deserti]MCT7660318.1 hypothetical protein [Mycobacterium deserti]